MEKEDLSTLIILKIICCGALLFFVFGGLGLLVWGLPLLQKEATALRAGWRAVIIRIGVFASRACRRCEGAVRIVQKIAKDIGADLVEWREVDYAVALGVLAVPTIAIGGKRMFTALPSKPRLRNAIQYYLASGRSDQGPTHTAIATAIADDGTVFVADYENHQIQKWWQGE